MNNKQNELDKARLEHKRWNSILEMMKGNTDIDFIRKLEREWLEPVEERIKGLETEAE